jgi:hypothetical protein
MFRVKRQLRPLNCHGGCYFWLDPKVTKKSSQQRGFLPHLAFALHSRQNHGLQYFCHTSFAQFHRFSKKLLCPIHNTAHQVLPALARSLPADGGTQKSWKSINPKNHGSDNQRNHINQRFRQPCVRDGSGYRPVVKACVV